MPGEVEFFLGTFHSSQVHNCPLVPSSSAHSVEFLSSPSDSGKFLDRKTLPDNILKTDLIFRERERRNRSCTGYCDPSLTKGFGFASDCKDFIDSKKLLDNSNINLVLILRY
jgi:hypothetical protein